MALLSNIKSSEGKHSSALQCHDWHHGGPMFWAWVCSQYVFKSLFESNILCEKEDCNTILHI